MKKILIILTLISLIGCVGDSNDVTITNAHSPTNEKDEPCYYTITRCELYSNNLNMYELSTKTSWVYFNNTVYIVDTIGKYTLGKSYTITLIEQK